MRPRQLLVSAALLSAACLTACASPQPITKIETQYLKAPDALLVCGQEPAVPPASATDGDIAQWILSMKVAGEDCRDRLGKVKQLQDADATKEKK